MPTYDYACRDCGATIEVIHAMSADGPSVCERCGGELRRVLHPAGIIFKGSGFYRTDSRAASNGTGSAPKTKEATSGGSTASGATTESASAPAKASGSAED